MSKLKGSTILEVLVAMLIILICLGLVFTAYVKMSFEISDEQRVLAEIIMDKEASETISNHDFENKTYQSGDIIIKRTILPYNQHNNLKLLFIESFTLSEKKIADFKQLIIYENKATLH